MLVCLCVCMGRLVKDTTVKDSENKESLSGSLGVIGSSASWLSGSGPLVTNGMDVRLKVLRAAPDRKPTLRGAVDATLLKGDKRCRTQQRARDAHGLGTLTHALSRHYRSRLSVPVSLAKAVTISEQTPCPLGRDTSCSGTQKSNGVGWEWIGVASCYARGPAATCPSQRGLGLSEI